MSYSHNQAVATCKVKNYFTNTTDIAEYVYDYLTNHEDEIPTNLDPENFKEFADIIESYVELSNDVLTIKLDTEEFNQDCEIFDFLQSYFAHIMTSKFMRVVWMTYDSKAGMEANCYYYDNNDDLIDVESILNAM